MSKKRYKRTEPQHKLREYLETKKDSQYDITDSIEIKRPDLTKLKNFSTVLSAERFYKIVKFYNDDIASVIDYIFPDLKLPNKPKKKFGDERSIIENILLPLPKDYMSLEEIAYLTDIDIDRLKEILSKSTVVISASELILLERVKKLKPGTLFKAVFGHIKIKRVKKK